MMLNEDFTPAQGCEIRANKVTAKDDTASLKTAAPPIPTDQPSNVWNARKLANSTTSAVDGLSSTTENSPHETLAPSPTGGNKVNGSKRPTTTGEKKRVKPSKGEYSRELIESAALTNGRIGRLNDRPNVSSELVSRNLGRIFAIS